MVKQREGVKAQGPSEMKTHQAQADSFLQTLESLGKRMTGVPEVWCVEN